ncbi:sensor histidine kinase [Flavobacterium microcysteis]|uniref:histidine kinase n=1 Tax=Flavobacterium microcysteis TaxID=2596891 RepID=A0A501QAN1_9FLAO|nr:ATP-binding protein [Flavobacterium microcysteis]TPD69949.1 hypothetical protein FJA49_08565 [Flavobacterium microcysteis]
MLNNVAFGIIIGLLFISLLILFCVVLVKLYIRKIKNYTEVIYQKDIDFQKTVNQTILETQEQVLQNISQDLHDDAGQQLTYINFQIENLKLDSPELNQTLQPLSQSVSNLSQSIRNISHSLNNQMLLQQDLVKAIESEIIRLQKSSIPIHFELKGKDKRIFSTNEKIVIYRIFQEIMNNCFKHSKASQIEIRLRASPNFEMAISDNGKGFDYEKIKNSPTTMGLQNIISRAAIIDYSVNIWSENEKGTKIRLSENKLP